MSPPLHGMPWSDQQREWLQALGHEVLVPAASLAAHEPEPSMAAPVAARGMPPPAAPPVQDRANPAAAVPDTALLRALARAAGRQPQDAEFLGILPDLSALRGSPAARRALWPRLRALRKRG